MNNRTPVDQVNQALHGLDPAPDRELSSTERLRADATLERILSEPIDDRALVKPKRRGRRAGLIAAAVAALAVPAFVVSNNSSAFGSWTPIPETLTNSEAADAVATCRSTLDLPEAEARVLMAERRGDWTHVMFAAADGEGSCLMPERLLSGDATQESGFFGEYNPEPPEMPTMKSDAFDEGGGTMGTVEVPGPIPGLTRDGWFVWVTGYVGTDVTAVTVHPPVGPDVEASIAGGRYAAWWPDGMPQDPNSGYGQAWSYTVTFADGTERDIAGE